MSRSAYIIALRPAPDPRDPKGIRRLRAMLKLAGRQYGLRCLSIRESEPESPKGNRETETRAATSPAAASEGTEPTRGTSDESTRQTGNTAAGDFLHGGISNDE